jgi:hypothetical protein
MKTVCYKYCNKETEQLGSKKIVRKVSIKNGKGYKSVTKYHKGKKTGSSKKQIHKSHIESIKNRKFVPGLFLDCKCK